MRTLKELYEIEDSKLSPLAVTNRESEERLFIEEPHPYRLPLHRDRDRVYHSRAFKRLEYKTQVFINSEGDLFRTRLTHTMEVVGVSRTVCIALGLNDNLAEVIALCHDLGHTPFGHAGQDILSELMKSFGGFEHNKQSLRIVQKLENRYSDFPGLNLCRMTLIGLLKHGAAYEDSDLLILRNENGPSLEALIVDYSDEIAYNIHDMEDGLESGILSTETLSEIPLWDYFWKKGSAFERENGSELHTRKTLRSVMNAMVTDLIQNISDQIQEHKIQSRENFSELWRNGKRIINYSEKMQSEILNMKRFLNEKLYQNPAVKNKSDYGKKIIERLFYFFQKNFSEIPESYRERNTESRERIICDYVAGMTDRYAEKKITEYGLN
ncbi:MAG TPA: deoxyguanosinetriphosphate triphosphohydrolase [Leptospiraceae bacterium]|nr:deoxyguanosinetriphosphate triphosphohydrolase [Leptospiraceae bacterium]